MSKFFTILTAMCLTAASSLSCTASTAPKVKNNKKTAKTMPPKKSQVAATDTIESLRYELYKDGVSEVYYYTHNNKLNSSMFYTRDMGDNTGWTYTVTPEPVMPLSLLAAELNLSQYPDYNLDNEDTSRDRWIVIVKYVNGKEKTICVYTDATTAEGDKVVREKAEATFKAIKFKDKDGKMMGEYTKSTYANGKLVKEINYTQDGIVHGGRDYTKPNDMEYALPPKTY